MGDGRGCFGNVFDDSERTIICNCRYETEIVYEGAYKTTGYLKEVSVGGAFFIIEDIFPVGTKCFIKMYIEGENVYSRGKIISNSAIGSHIGLENGFAVFTKLAQGLIYDSDSVLRRIMISRKIHSSISKQVGRNEAKRKINCWEFNACGKEERCSAGTSREFDGIFGGTNGGRFCAFIEGTLYKDDLSTGVRDKLMSHCLKCSFYEEITKELSFSGGGGGIEKLFSVCLKCVVYKDFISQMAMRTFPEQK
ncbi:MAG: hypothetical protein H7833_00995 [Magnetococcus sp. DMHC-1]